MTPTAGVVEWLRNPHVVRGLVSLAVVGAAVLTSSLLSRTLARRVTEVEARYRARKAARYLCAGAALAALVVVWFHHLGQLGWALGLLGAGVALALAGPIGCLAGWLYIVVRRPFDVGDRVQIGQVKGDVIDIQMIHTTLMEVGGWVDAEQSTGRMLLVPNQRVFSELIHNYTKGFPFVWNEMSILVTFESDWRRAKELLLELAQANLERIEPRVRHMLERVSRRYALRFGRLTPIVYTRIAESGVELTLRHLVEARQRRGTASALSEAVLQAIAEEPNVELAYPTQRITGLEAGRQGAAKSPAPPPASSAPAEEPRENHA